MSDTAPSMAQLIDVQIQHLDALRVLLEKESDELQGAANGETLEQLAEAKQRHLAELDRLETCRRQAQIQLGCSDDTAGAEQAADATDCLPQWQQLVQRARLAGDLNTLNGELIRQRMAHNSLVLDTLRTLAGNPLYGTDGQSGRRGNSLSVKA